MSPKSNADRILRPGSAPVAAASASWAKGDRLESLAALWARQTGQRIRVAAPR